MPKGPRSPLSNEALKKLAEEQGGYEENEIVFEDDLEEKLNPRPTVHELAEFGRKPDGHMGNN